MLNHALTLFANMPASEAQALSPLFVVDPEFVPIGLPSTLSRVQSAIWQTAPEAAQRAGVYMAMARMVMEPDTRPYVDVLDPRWFIPTFPVVLEESTGPLVEVLDAIAEQVRHDPSLYRAVLGLPGTVYGASAARDLWLVRDNRQSQYSGLLLGYLLALEGARNAV